MTIRKGPLLVMDRGQALRSLAHDLNASFAAMYAKFESSGDEIPEGTVTHNGVVVTHNGTPVTYNPE